MAHLSLYRKYRSQTFGDLIGQDHVVKTIQAAIAQSRISHSYLFTGPRGTGKTSSARLLAKALCCVNGPAAEPCNECDICTSITEGSCIDVIEMDAASDSGVDDIREKIVEVTEYKPMIARYKVFIIDEVHDLSAKAFDALLKTIEEPPPHIVFILATTEYQKVPPTIRSRCQKYEFHRATMTDLVGRLNYVVNGEGFAAEPSAITAIARMADGGYRDALTLLEQALLTSEGTVTLQQVYDQLGLVAEDTVDRIVLAMHRGQIVDLIQTLEEVTRLGRDPRSLLESMLIRLGDLTRAAYEIESGVDSARQASLHETAQLLGRETLLRIRSALSEAHKEIRDITLPRLWLESELIRIATQVLPQTPVVAARPVAAVQAPAAAVPQVREAPVAPPVAPKPSLASQVEKIAPTKPRYQEPPVETVKATQIPKTEPVPAAKPTAPRPVGDKWTQVVFDLNTLSKTLGMKMQGSKANEDSDGRLIVELSSKLAYDWITEKPKVTAEIRRVVREIYGEQFVPEFTVTQREAVDPADHAVESPAEGLRLEQIVRTVFSDIDGSSTAQTADQPLVGENPTDEGQQE